MNSKSRDASISERLNHIHNQNGLAAALSLVAEKRLGVAQKEADAWVAKKLRWQTLSRICGFAVGLASIIAAVAAIIALFPRTP